MLYSCTHFTVSLTAKIEMFMHEKIKYDLCEFLAYQLVNEIENACAILSTFGPTAIKPSLLVTQNMLYSCMYFTVSLTKIPSKLKCLYMKKLKMTFVNFWLIGW
jgi:hypothetical protein